MIHYQFQGKTSEHSVSVTAIIMLGPHTTIDAIIQTQHYTTNLKVSH